MHICLFQGSYLNFLNVGCRFVLNIKAQKGKELMFSEVGKKKNVDQIQFEKAIIVILQHLYFHSIAPPNICHTKQLQVRKYFFTAKEYSSYMYSHSTAVSAQTEDINTTFYSVELCRYSGPWPYTVKSKVRSGDNVLQWLRRRCERCTNDTCIINQEVESD